MQHFLIISYMLHNPTHFINSFNSDYHVMVASPFIDMLESPLTGLTSELCSSMETVKYLAS